MTNNIKKFSHKYLNKLNQVLKKVNYNELNKASNTIKKKVQNKKNIFVAGNGGSASIANHWVTDLTKTLADNSRLRAKVISLNSNYGLISAISNDISHNEVFSYQLERYANLDDLLILISSSGNSLNIKKTMKYAERKKIQTIGFSGFKGGYLKKKSNISIHIPIDNYGIVEDCHHFLMHMITQFLSKKK